MTLQRVRVVDTESTDGVKYSVVQKVTELLGKRVIVESKKLGSKAVSNTSKSLSPSQRESALRLGLFGTESLPDPQGRQSS